MDSEKKAKPLKDKPIYFVVRGMIDPVTGYKVGCLVPNGWTNQKLMRERKYRANDHLRATITNPRSQKFHGLVHRLGAMVVDNIAGFELLNSHDAIKRLQREAGICCDIEQMDASPVIDAILKAAETMLGETATKMLRAVLPEIKTIEVKVAQSIAFDSMDESDFRIFWTGICGHLVANYWVDLSEDQINKLTELMPQSEGL